MLTIENNGKEIVSTNYWQSEHAALGYIFCSINAGALRLLVPPKMEAQVIKEAAGCSEVLVSIGPWLDAGGQTGAQFLFEDQSPNPFFLYVLDQLMDRLPSKEDAGKEFECIFYTQDGGAVLRKPLRLKFVDSIPCYT